MMYYDEKDRCDVSYVYDRLGDLFKKNGMFHFCSGLQSIPVAPEIPQPDIEEKDDPAT